MGGPCQRRRSPEPVGRPPDTPSVRKDVARPAEGTGRERSPPGSASLGLGQRLWGGLGGAPSEPRRPPEESREVADASPRPFRL